MAVDAGDTEHNRAVTVQLWTDLYRRDFDAVAGHFHDDGTYTDVPTPAEDVAVGPAQIAARLRLGLEPLHRIEHDIGRIVAEGDVVVTEHVETWFWSEEQSVALPFVSVHEFRDERIARWSDYWDLQTLLAAAPSGGSTTSSRAGSDAERAARSARSRRTRPHGVGRFRYHDGRRGRRPDRWRPAPAVLKPRLLATAAVMAAIWLPLAAGAQTEAESERERVQEDQAELEDQLDVLQASEQEIAAVLDDIDGALAAQQAAVDAAEAAAADAETAVRGAEADLRVAQRDVRLLEGAIAEMAVASFVHPPTVDLVQSLQAVSLSDALLQKTYLNARAKRDLSLLDLLETAEAEADARAAELAAASAQAEAALTTAQQELASLGEEQARQQAFANDLQGRIDARLAEAAVLADLDAELAEQIAAEQAALIERIPPPVEPVIATASPPTTVPPTTAPTTTGGGSDPTATPTSTSTPPTTNPPPPPGGTEPPPLRTVQGITVHADIADDVDALLTAARDDGVSLSGWGYRSTERQIELRRANCGPTYYDIWYKPPSLCRPPTARPGQSLHERGRAIDFTYEGRIITSRSNPGFRWLADNASSYGLFNLPSEPWHWSTSGG